MKAEESLDSKSLSEKLKDIKFTLAISYNNGAIEYEYLGKQQMALDFFLNAAIISE